MKKALLILLLPLLSCGGVEDLGKYPKPLVIEGKHLCKDWWDSPHLLVRDGEGKLHDFDDMWTKSIMDAHNVGDTLK